MKQDFSYIAVRIREAEFLRDPFEHIYVENFFSREDLALLTAQEQIRLLAQATTDVLLEKLFQEGWQIQEFPGCTSSIDEYLTCLESDEWPVDKGLLEGFGMAFRLANIRHHKIAALMTFLNSTEFQEIISIKFNISRPTRVETSIQKYLTGYEISPHPDIRSKALTYLININTADAAAAQDVHTHLLTFNDEYRFLYDFWRYNMQWDTTWVPWAWCRTKKTISQNNTLLAFAPSYDTLHAVKLRYNHLEFQRTQVYGNLWYTDVPFMLPRVPYTQFVFKAETR